MLQRPNQLQHIQTDLTGSHDCTNDRTENMGCAMRNTAFTLREIMTDNVFIEIQLYKVDFAYESWL